jgi:hypothetical protein
MFIRFFLIILFLSFKVIAKDCEKPKMPSIVEWNDWLDNIKIPSYSEWDK